MSRTGGFVGPENTAAPTRQQIPEPTPPRLEHVTTAGWQFSFLMSPDADPDRVLLYDRKGNFIGVISRLSTPDSEEGGNG